MDTLERPKQRLAESGLDSYDAALVDEPNKQVVTSHVHVGGSMSSLLQSLRTTVGVQPFDIHVPSQSAAVLFTKVSGPMARLPARIAGRPLSIAVFPSLCIFIPPGADSSWHSTRDNADGWFHLHFPKHAFDQAAQEHRAVMSRPIVRSDHRLDTLSSYARELASSEESPSPLLWDSLCVLLLHRICAIAASEGDSEKRAERLSAWQVRRVVDFLSDHLASPVTLADLAGLVELSPYHFARAFKNTVGIPPHRYQVMIRIEKAKALLVGSAASILDVACLVGYESHSSFARSFKREVGVSPVRFRADHRGDAT